MIYALYGRAAQIDLGAAPPDWIELLPAGPDITGADGRAWTLPDPQTVIAAFQRRATPLVIDWEHATEQRAPQGLDAPAAGWIDALEVRDGAVWGRVAWTEKAAAQLAAREYRYLSPVFLYEKATRRIISLASAGLTNTPNLNLTALNREDSPVALPDELYTALGLPVGTDQPAVLAAIHALKHELAAAQNRAQMPALDKFVPRADYDAALARASHAEQQLQAQAEAQQNSAIEAALNAALQAGQISPATVDYYRAGCRQEGGLERFQQFRQVAPPLLGAAAVPAAPPPDAAPKALNRAAFDAKTPREQRDFLAAGGRVTD